MLGRATTECFSTDAGTFDFANSYALGNVRCKDAETAPTAMSCDGTELTYPPGGCFFNRPHVPLTVGGQTVAMDPIGNLTAVGSRSYTYDLAGRLTQVRDAGATRATFTYDAFGDLHRITELTGASTVERRLLAPDFEWNATAGQGSLVLTLGGTTIATHTEAFTPPPSCGGCVCTDVASLGSGGTALHLFFPGLAALLLFQLGMALTRRPPGERLRPVLAATTAGAFLVVVVVPLGLGRSGGAASAAIPVGVGYYHTNHLGSTVRADIAGSGGVPDFEATNSTAVGPNARALADAARAEGELFSAQVPQGLVSEPTRIGLAEQRLTQMGTVVGTELRFLPAASEFVAPHSSRCSHEVVLCGIRGLVSSL